MSKTLTKEEFLEKLKTDSEFNSKYGRKHITEGKMVLPPCHYGFQVYTRELTWYERHELAETKYRIDDVDDVLDKEDIPTRLITITYNDKKIESYK